MPDERSRREIGRLTGDVIPALIARLGASSLGELEVRQDGWRVRIRRNGVLPVPAPEGRSRRGQRAVEPRERDHPAADAASMRPVGPGRDRAREAAGRTVSSPAVGYYAPVPELATGRRVEAGDVLGHVDVLGVRQDVVAPASGIVARLLAQPGEAVEYGQELVHVEPLPRAGAEED